MSHLTDINNTQNDGSATNRTDTSGEKSLKVSKRKDSYKRKTMEPLIFCTFITKHPIKAFAITMGIYVIAALFSLTLTMYLDLFPIRFAGIKFEVRSSIYTQRRKAFEDRETAPNLLTRIEISNQEIPSSYYEVIFVAKDKANILTHRHLKSISDFQKDIFKIKDYEHFCYRQTAATGCAPPLSLVNFFLPSSNFSNIPAVLNTKNPKRVQMMQLLLGKTSQVNSTYAYSPITRVMFRMGRPLNNSKGQKEDIEKADKFLRYNVTPFLKKLAESAPTGLQVYFFGKAFADAETDDSTRVDMFLAIGSCLFIFIFLCTQTWSLWLGFSGIIMIAGSFLLANLAYRFVLGFRYFGVLHVLSIFVILGIGADDIFVFVDTWRHYSRQTFPSEAHRLSQVYRQASVATAQTSITTIVAFLASAISPLLTISSFGVFSALVVLLTYVSVITFFPTALMFGEMVLNDKGNGCRANKVNPEVEYKPKEGFVTKFFKNQYFEIITHKVFRWIILAFFVIFTGVAVYYTIQLEPEDRQIRIFRSHSNIEIANSYRLNDFAALPQDATVIVNIDWGLLPQDVSSCKFREDDECDGHLRLDPDFDMNSPEAQIGMREFCRKLMNANKTMVNELSLKVNPITKRPIVRCFILEMEDYLNKTEGLSLPFTETNVLPFMKRKRRIYNTSTLDPEFNNFFEVMLTYWLTDGYTFRNREKFVLYHKFLGEQKTNFTNFIDINGFKSHWGGKLIYMTVVVELNLNFHVLSYVDGLKVADNWEKYMKEEMSLMPNSTNKGFQESLKWPGLMILKSMAVNAVQGIIIGICTSLIILTITTTNVFVALLATTTIAFVTNGVVASIVLADWKLGPLESINMCLVVGLAVDYVVHLAEAYNRSLHYDRINRVRDALEQVGKSVLSGAITSLGASIFMIFARIIFFVQFGIFMFTTIGLSFLFSTCFFCTLIGMCGPEGNIGSLKHFRTCCPPFISRRVKPLTAKSITLPSSKSSKEEDNPS